MLGVFCSLCYDAQFAASSFVTTNIEHSVYLPNVLLYILYLHPSFNCNSYVQGLLSKHPEWVDADLSPPAQETALYNACAFGRTEIARYSEHRLSAVPCNNLFRIYYFKTNTFERRPVVFGVFTCAHVHTHIHHADIQTDVLTRPVMMCGAVKPGGCWNTQVLIHYWKRKTKKHHFTLHPNMGTLLASSCCWLTARIPTRKMWAGRCLRT